MVKKQNRIFFCLFLFMYFSFFFLHVSHIRNVRNESYAYGMCIRINIQLNRYRSGMYLNCSLFESFVTN